MTMTIGLDSVLWHIESAKALVRKANDVIDSQAEEIERLRKAGDDVVRQLREMIDRTLVEQAAMHGSIAVDVKPMRAVAKWEEARRG
jgi:predicted HicB family RNase H-like nuclease